MEIYQEDKICLYRSRLLTFRRLYLLYLSRYRILRSQNPDSLLPMGTRHRIVILGSLNTCLILNGTSFISSAYIHILYT